MTIHSEWAKIFYKECPMAFMDTVKKSSHFYGSSGSRKQPQSWGVGVIDGHLQLMCLNERMISWNRFIEVMFLYPIRQMFKLGCPTVVLCFDSYEHVPAYKNMTQLKRSQGRTVCTFDVTMDLPPKIPNDAMKYLMNRPFKAKVIQMICRKLPYMISLNESQELIIDYKSIVMYNASSFSHGHMKKTMPSLTKGLAHLDIDDVQMTVSEPVPIPVNGMVPMGESDVKFTRYVEKYGNALIHAIDGDYMIIALLYYANVGIKDQNKIFIYRQKQKGCPDILDEKPSLPLPPRKRKYGDVQTDDEEEDRKKTSIQTTHKEKTEEKHRNKKCWVDMQLIYLSLLESFRQSQTASNFCIGNNQCNEKDMIRACVFLILCAGTDFSRSLPLIGPVRLWEHLPYISENLLTAVKNENSDCLLDACIAKIYKNVFSKHICIGSPYTWKRIYNSLNSSTLSKSTKEKFPGEMQLVTTIKNVLWVMQYWSAVNDNVPTPLDGSNGYILCQQSKKVVFENQSRAKKDSECVGLADEC